MVLPGKNMVLWRSISIVLQLMEEDIIDEYHLQVCPVLNAGGRKLFTDVIQPELRLLEVRHKIP
jgi:hypothetical protein